MWRTLLVFGLLLSCTLSLGRAEEPATSRAGLFEQGLEAYQKKQYQQAREAFQKVVEQSGGVDSASATLLHNLALSAYQLDQKAFALALWRKALSAEPGFRPARVGRDLLESKSQMRPFERDSFSLWQRRTLESVSFQQMLWLNALLMAMAGWLGIRFLSERRQALETEMPLPPFPLIGLVLSTLFVASLVLIGFKAKDMTTTRATVLAARANVRSLPSDDGAGLFEMMGGTEVLVRRGQSGWWQAQNSEGSSGWVKAADVMITSGSPN